MVSAATMCEVLDATSANYKAVLGESTEPAGRAPGRRRGRAARACDGRTGRRRARTGLQAARLACICSYILLNLGVSLRHARPGMPSKRRPGKTWATVRSIWRGRAPLHERALVVLLQAQLLLDAAQLLGEEVAPLVLADLLLHALPDLALQLAQLDLLLQQQQRGLRPARARAPAAPQPPRARLSSRPRPQRPPPPPPAVLRTLSNARAALPRLQLSYSRVCH